MLAKHTVDKVSSIVQLLFQPRNYLNYSSMVQLDGKIYCCYQIFMSQ